ncbi:hypothetical protein D5F12_24070 [Serratia marcescens]|nr:hypothetical protein D4G80_24060 [Serratia marcescens]RXG74364.1 hypothetical protein D5F12_24070 [Serratia marcescens]
MLLLCIECFCQGLDTKLIRLSGGRVQKLHELIKFFNLPVAAPLRCRDRNGGRPSLAPCPAINHNEFHGD